MSLDATRWAYCQRIKPAVYKFVLVAMADRADDHHCCFPSAVRLAFDTGLDVKTVRKALDALKAYAFIDDTGRRVGETKSVVVYRLSGVTNREDEGSTPVDGYTIDLRESKPHQQTVTEAQKASTPTDGYASDNSDDTSELSTSLPVDGCASRSSLPVDGAVSLPVDGLKPTRGRVPESTNNLPIESTTLCANRKKLSTSLPDNGHTSENCDDATDDPPEEYRTAKGKILSGFQLCYFDLFWDAFDYKRDRAKAADAWLALKVSDERCSENDLVDRIVSAAEREAKARPKLKESGLTPIMAHGWLSGRRFEDETNQHLPDKKTVTFVLDGERITIPGPTDHKSINALATRAMVNIQGCNGYEALERIRTKLDKLAA